MSVPQKCFFYNLKQSIDEPSKPFSAAALDSISGTFDDSLLPDSTATTVETLKELSPGPVMPFYDPDVPLYSCTTLRKTIAPVLEWFPFNPADNKRLCNASPSDEPIAVGHERLLFQVHHLSSLRPTYWSIAYATKVCHVRWVFSDTLTPIDPVWDDAIFPHFMNFRNNALNYKEILEKSLEDPAHMRVIAQRLDLKQAGRNLKLDLLFSPENSWVYIFKANGNYICAKNTASSLLHGAFPRGVIAILKPFDFKEYKSLYNVPDRPTDDAEYTPRPINNLILVFHGIGQKLSSSYTRINFVYAIDKLRVEIQQACDSKDVYQHFPGGERDSVRSLVLAVNWRTAFNPCDSVNVDSITVPSIIPIRRAFNDALLDIPLYMSENRKPQMLAAAANEANRIYALVKKHHPLIETSGRVSLVGHSLGSLIASDLLTNQPSILNESTIETAPLKFQTHSYFTTGSMLGVFLVLKGQHLVPRKEFDDECRANGLNPDEAEERPFGCFAVRNFYNIVHQSDLLSFMVNATVKGAQDPEVGNLTGNSGLVLEIDQLPQVSAAAVTAALEISHPAFPTLKESSSRLFINRFFIAQLAKLTKESNKKEIEAEDIAGHQETDELPLCIHNLLERFKNLNENGQIDWKIPQPPSYMPSHYLKMFTAHFDYWSNREVARFLAIECGRSPGPENCVPEHKVKWTFTSKRGESA